MCISRSSSPFPKANSCTLWCMYTMLKNWEWLRSELYVTSRFPSETLCNLHCRCVSSVTVWGQCWPTTSWHRCSPAPPPLPSPPPLTPPPPLTLPLLLRPGPSACPVVPTIVAPCPAFPHPLWPERLGESSLPPHRQVASYKHKRLMLNYNSSG